MRTFIQELTTRFSKRLSKQSGSAIADGPEHRRGMWISSAIPCSRRCAPEAACRAKGVNDRASPP
jgi:hypothetical protein